MKWQVAVQDNEYNHTPETNHTVCPNHKVGGYSPIVLVSLWKHLDFSGSHQGPQARGPLRTPEVALALCQNEPAKSVSCHPCHWQFWRKILLRIYKDEENLTKLQKCMSLCSLKWHVFPFKEQMDSSMWFHVGTTPDYPPTVHPPVPVKPFAFHTVGGLVGEPEPS